MTIDDLLVGSTGWLTLHAPEVFLISFAWPLLGTVAAWLGKGGKTDADGRFIASVVMALSMLFFLLEVLAIAYGVFIEKVSLLNVNVLLLGAPVVALGLSVVGLRTVFPLGRLAPVRLARDLGFFLLVVGVVAWFLSKFHGWSIFFLGTFGQLLLAGAVVLAMLWWLWQRIFSDADGPADD